MPRRLPRALAAGLLLGGLVSGCGDGSEVRTSGTLTGSRPTASPSATSVSATSPSPSPSAASAAPVQPVQVHRTFPVAGRADYGHTHHDYPATDIFAACGTPVRAAVDGVVLEVSRVDRFDPSHPAGEDKGGLSVSILGDDGVRYYGSHLSSVDNGIEAGVRLSAGTRLGAVGQTGNASHVCHLHFGLSPACQRVGDWWVRRGVFYPWKYLDSWRTGGDLSPVDEAAGWQRDHGCPTAPTPGTR